MSSSIIEAKFQALDRTIRLLNKTSIRAKVASSDQLRELVCTQQRPQSAVKYSDEKETTRKTPMSEGRPQTARGDLAGQPSKTLNGATRVDLEIQPEPTETRFDRTQMLLRESWNEIESSVPRTHASSARSPSAPVQPSASREAKTEAREGSPRCQAPTSPRSSNQAHDARDTRARLHSGRSGEPSKRFIFDEQRRNLLGPEVEIGNELKPTGRNWFATQPQQRPSSSLKKSRRVVPQSKAGGSSSEDTPLSHPEMESKESTELIDCPSFYFLEVRLDHSSPLVDWRFRATFTDLSVLPRPSVIVDNVPVDARNCLLFTTASGTPGSSIIIRYFDPVFHFPHVTKPRDLYGHCIRILVHSTTPVQRVVIDTLIHFLLDDGPSQTEAPSQSSAVPSYSPAKPKTHSARKPEKLELVLPRAKALPTNTECSAWEIHDDSEDVHRHGPSSQRSMASPRNETDVAATTTDKKRIQLKEMRSNMRRKLRDEHQQLRRDQQLRLPQC